MGEFFRPNHLHFFSFIYILQKFRGSVKWQEIYGNVTLIIQVEVIWQPNNNTNRVLLCSIKTPINVSSILMFLVKHNISNNSSSLHVNTEAIQTCDLEFTDIHVWKKCLVHWMALCISTRIQMFMNKVWLHDVRMILYKYCKQSSLVVSRTPDRPTEDSVPHFWVELYHKSLCFDFILRSFHMNIYVKWVKF